MAYEIKHGPDQTAIAERLETATACLERIKALQAKQALNIKIYDRNGAKITIAELEKRAEKEMILKTAVGLCARASRIEFAACSCISTRRGAAGLAADGL